MYGKKSPPNIQSFDGAKLLLLLQSCKFYRATINNHKVLFIS